MDFDERTRRITEHVEAICELNNGLISLCVIPTNETATTHESAFFGTTDLHGSLRENPTAIFALDLMAAIIKTLGTEHKGGLEFINADNNSSAITTKILINTLKEMVLNPKHALIVRQITAPLFEVLGPSLDTIEKLSDFPDLKGLIDLLKAAKGKEVSVVKVESKEELEAILDNLKGNGNPSGTTH